MCNMPLGLSYINEFVLCYKLYLAKKKRRDMVKTIAEEATSDKSPKKRTISEWIKEFKNLEEKGEINLAVDRPVSFSLVEEEREPTFHRAVWWHRKHHKRNPSERYLKFWNRLNLIGKWDEENLHYWVTKFEEKEILIDIIRHTKVNNRYSIDKKREFARLQEEMIMERIESE